MTKKPAATSAQKESTDAPERPIRAVLYDAAGHDEDIDPSAVPVKALRDDQLLWVDGPLDALRASKHVPADIRAALGNYTGTCGLEILDPVYRVTVPSSHEVGNGKSLGFIVGKAWLVTVTDPRPAFLDRFVDTDLGETLNGRMTPSALAVALLTELLDSYRSELSNIARQVDKLDEAILTFREKRTPLQTLAVLRRKVSLLRSILDETGITLHAMVRPDFLTHIDAADHGYFEGLSRAHERVEDMVARARDIIVGSFDLYTTRVAQETNQLVKVLTIVTVVTGIIGAVAGIFGMNFDTPFAHTGTNGFIIVTAAMALSAATFVAVAIWRKWL